MEQTAVTKPATSPWAWLALCAAAYAASLLLLSRGLPFDEALSELFFTRPCTAANSHSCWTFDKSDGLSTFLLHTVPAKIFTGIAIAAALVWLASFKVQKLRPWRSLCFALVLGIGGTSGIVAYLKHVTGHYCPSQLGLFDGPVKTLPFKGPPNPICFPAAHPSPGFGLMVLYFAPVAANVKRFGLVAGLATGGLLGVIQIARGEHYFSHVIASALTALFIGALLYFGHILYRNKFNASAPR